MNSVWLLAPLLVATLRFGGDLQGGAPYAYQSPEDATKIIGFEVELGRAIARELGETEAFIQTDWTTLTAGLGRGTYDAAMNGLEDTPARRAAFALTRPYYRFDLQLVTRADDARGLAGRIGTLEGTLAADYLRGQPGVEVKLYQGVEEPYLDLLRGRIEGVLMDSVIGDVYGKKPGLKVAQPSVGAGDYVVACSRKDELLCSRIDRALQQIRQSGELKQILERYALWNARQEELALVERPPEPSHDNTVQAARFGGTHLLAFLRAAWVTLWVSCLAMVLACSIGVLLALGRVFGSAPVSRLSAFIVESVRGTPILLQLYLVYFGLAPWLALPPLAAAILTLGVNYGAYEAEIYRSGLMAVSPGQFDAGAVLGLTRSQVLRLVVVPQAFTVALPGMANDFVSLLKDSALVSVITVVELTKQMSITAVDVRSWVEPGLVCAILYMAMSYPASRLALYLEQRLSTERTR